jgi:hypothetical protein
MSKHRSRDEQPSRVAASDWLPPRSANWSLPLAVLIAVMEEEMVRYV